MLDFCIISHYLPSSGCELRARMWLLSTAYSFVDYILLRFIASAGVSHTLTRLLIWFAIMFKLTTESGM